MKKPKLAALLILVLLTALVVVSRAVPQQQISGSPPVSIVQGGNTATVSASGALKVDGSGVTQPVSGTFWQATQPVSGTVTITPSGTQTITGAITNTAFGVNGGSANIGIIRAVPSSCTQSTNFSNATVRVATGHAAPILIVIEEGAPRLF